MNALARVLPPVRRFELLPLWLNALLTGLVLILFLVLIAVITNLLGYFAINMPTWVFNADLGLYRRIAGHDDALTSFIIAFLNDPGLDYSVVIAVCLAYVWLRKRTALAPAVIALGVALIVGAWTIPFTHSSGVRPRPFTFAPDVIVNPIWREIWAAIPSFPSGHIRELTGLTVILAYFWPGSRWFALAYASFIAFSRLYIGAHFPTDVFAGILIGLLSGSFAVLAVDRGQELIRALVATPGIRKAYEYVYPTREQSSQETNTWQATALRLALPLAALIIVTFLLGSIVYVQSPRILADYFRNTDSSVVYPILRRFDPSTADWIYHTLVDGTKTLVVLALLVLGYAAFRNRQDLGRRTVMIVSLIIVDQLVLFVLSNQYARPRPFASDQNPLPLIWQQHWSSQGTFPDPYLLYVMALCTLLAGTWRALRVPAYGYPFLVCIGLFYFGLVWPTDAVATLLVGYLVGHLALYTGRQVWSSARRTEMARGNEERE